MSKRKRRPLETPPAVFDLRVESENHSAACCEAITTLLPIVAACSGVAKDQRFPLFMALVSLPVLQFSVHAMKAFWDHQEDEFDGLVTTALLFIRMVLHGDPERMYETEITPDQFLDDMQRVQVMFEMGILQRMGWARIEYPSDPLEAGSRVQFQWTEEGHAMMVHMSQTPKGIAAIERVQARMREPQPNEEKR